MTDHVASGRRRRSTFRAVGTVAALLATLVLAMPVPAAEEDEAKHGDSSEEELAAGSDTAKRTLVDPARRVRARARYVLKEQPGGPNDGRCSR